MPKTTRLAGIVSVGGSHAQAVENFRKTATGQNSMFYRSESGDVYASQSNVDLFDPKGSTKLLEEDAELVAQAEFQSESSAANVKAQYHICLDGCGCHIVSDSSANITHCPSCSASLEEVSDDRILDHMENENKESVSRSSVVAVGTTLANAKQNLANAIRKQDVVTALSSATSFVACADGVHFDPYSCLPISESKVLESEEIQALSSNGKLEAHVYSCSANCAAPFTIATDDDTVFCAHCSAPLIDIASESSDDDSSDILEEEELEDDEGFDDDEEDEDDEEFDSESSSDEDEEEDDEEFDDEEFDDEEEEDDEDFDSESKSKTSCSGDDDDEEDDFDDEEEFDDEEFDDDEEEDEDDDFDDEEDEDFESESSVRNLNANDETAAEVRSFDSLSAVKAEHENLDPSLVSISRTVNGRVPAVHLFYDGQPIARATFSSFSNAAGEDSARRVFDKEDFIRAVSKSLHNAGVEETCKNFGFEPFVMQLSVSKMLTAEADARVNSVSSTVNSTVSDMVEAHRERFVAALSTSMLGITRNFWRDSSNPVVESLCATLRNAGIADPRPLVERAFFNNSEDFLRASLSQADALMAKSEVAQNEIAEAVAGTAGTVRQTKEAPKVPSVSKEEREESLETVESQSSSKESFDDILRRRFGR
ncbi:putative ATPase [Dickeya phage vB_DsoM_JA13]|uniref:Putative ATPase n=1 Tax=Dickeya phage vB_DsoM_JA13 TaxID=2283030 RepID=A0A384ZW97_9CAUD|nr:putative ATPase [Dickeya phage vB_DsoM_JA13]